MQHYQDNAGRRRSVQFTVAGVEAARAQLGIDLYNLEQLGSVAEDTLLFMRLVHLLQETGPDATGETFDEWWPKHTGDTAEAVTQAFYEAVCDFFPQRLAAPLRAMHAAILTAQNQALANLSGTSPDSLESTPDRSHSGSSSGCSKAASPNSATTPPTKSV